MDRKLIIIIAAAASSLIIILVSGLVYLKYTNPEIIGLPPLNNDTVKVVKDTIRFEPTYEITKEKLNDFELKVAEREAYIQLNKVMEDKIRALEIEDSLKQVQILALQDSVLPNKDLLLKESQTYSDMLKDSISKISSEKEKLASKAEIVEKEKTDLEKYIESEVDSLEMENFKQFAKIYNSSEPASVAQILETMDERDAAIILKNMRVKNAGKVIESMDPKKAALILLLANEK